jgi:hypothetical protein
MFSLLSVQGVFSPPPSKTKKWRGYLELKFLDSVFIKIPLSLKPLLNFSEFL